MVCLSKHKAGETIEYLDFALKSAEKTENYHEMGISSYYAAAVHFLYGDVFKAAQFTRKSIEQSLAAGLPQWADLARFLEGRLEFEIGHYSKAQELFETLRSDPCAGADQMTDDKDALLAAWIYRSKVYGQSPLTAKPEKACCDSMLFEIEAACLAGNFQKAAELSKVIINPFSKDNFLFTEQPDWSSGFAQCEHLYFSHGEIYDRMIYTFHSLALSRLTEKDGKEATDIMERILRNEQVSEMDPWDAFYFFTWYRILQHTGANPVEVNKAVSMAFKRLQRRASRIGDSEARRQDLNGPRWSRELCLTAKEFKLI
jgi:tetratricopeptide (TPR) repeat protein